MGCFNAGGIWVVVPDGLAADGRGNALPAPSFVYRQVLDYVARQTVEGREVLLAPGNRFGGKVAEQEAGAAHLMRAAPSAAVRFPVCGSAAYVDTHGNAAILREYLRRGRRWPPGPVDLVCARLHSARAELCFRRLGYPIRRVHRVPCRVPAGERVVRRLWYYRYPPVHAAYELLAIVRELFRGVRGGTVGPWQPIS